MLDALLFLAIIVVGGIVISKLFPKVEGRGG